MTRLEAALIEVAGVLNTSKIPYMLIGGLAVAQWGEPRAALDVDVTVWIDGDRLETAIATLVSRLPSRTQDPVAFVGTTRVLPVTTGGGVRSGHHFRPVAVRTARDRAGRGTAYSGCAARSIMPGSSANYRNWLELWAHRISWIFTGA
jgi:hypothetical protein